MRPLSERLRIPLLILLADICIGFVLYYWIDLTECKAPLKPISISFFIVLYASRVSSDVVKAPDLPQAYRKWLISLKWSLVFLLIYLAVKIWKSTFELALLQCDDLRVFPLDNWGHTLSHLQYWLAESHLKTERQRNSSLSKWLSEKIGLFTKEKEKLTREFSQSFQNTSQEELCPICLADFKIGEQIIALPKCSHAFHSECVFPWLSKTPVCPFCRRNVRSALYSFGE